MKKFLYCHMTKSNKYDDIAVVVAKNKFEAAAILSKYYSDVSSEFIHEIKSTQAMVKQNNIQIIGSY